MVKVSVNLPEENLMSPEKLSDHSTAEEQERIIGPIDRNRKRQFGEYAYQEFYCEIVFKLLSESDTAKTKAHCCHALQCAKTTLLRWMKKYPEFNEAITSGLEIGKMRWRDRIAEHSFDPTKDVNNGLIKLLSSNVYGIKDDPDTVVIQNNTINTDPEALMKKKGIPIPDVPIEDAEE